MTTHPFNLKTADPSWQDSIKNGLHRLDPLYLQELIQSNQWLPGPEQIFNAFSLPINQVNYVLFGESPYPRQASANGYAFWDAAVSQLWSDTGLSKPVNRATSMRNILKMLLIAEGLLKETDTSQEAIAAIDKTILVKTNNEFFTNLLRHGFLLLNATPVLQPGPPQKDARAWQPFVSEILNHLHEQRPDAKFVLFGRIAGMINQMIKQPMVNKICAEHPYNVSFITNKEVVDFFRPLHLLRLPSMG